MTHPIPNLSTRADQIAHYAAVKRRIHMASVKKPALVIAPTPAPQPIMPLWMRKKLRFNDHVNRWRMKLRKENPHDWLIERCQELDVDIRLITGPRRGRDIVKIRFQLIYEMSEKFQLSLPAIGRRFGDRDHTSILNALRKYKQMQNADD